MRPFCSRFGKAHKEVTAIPVRCVITLGQGTQQEAVKSGFSHCSSWSYECPKATSKENGGKANGDET